MNKLIFARDEEIEKLRARVRELENTVGKNHRIHVHELPQPSNLIAENNELKRLLIERDDEIAYLKNHMINLGHNVLEETIGYRVNGHRGERFLNEASHHHHSDRVRDYHLKGRRSLDGYQFNYDR